MNILEIAKANFEKWQAALKSRSPEIVAELYSDDCTFLPTLSPAFKRGKKEAESYFAFFLEKRPRVKIVEERVQRMGAVSYLHSGLYDFEIDKDGARVKVEARFTYVWRREKKGGWRIIHHHSSIRPGA